MKMTRTMYSPASRKNVDTQTDPYIPRKCPSATGVCPKCHAICRNKRWAFDEEAFRALSRKGEGIDWRRCPACRKIADGFPSGLVVLSGAWLAGHKGEVLNLVRNEEQRAMGFNPLARIMHLKDEGDRVEVATTDEKLAQRIGREVRKACRGALEYRWSEDAKLLRVFWAREA